jgi:hypothetical protein
MLDSGVMALGVVLTAAPVAAAPPCPVLEVGVEPLTPELVPTTAAAAAGVLLVDGPVVLDVTAFVAALPAFPAGT